MSAQQGRLNQALLRVTRLAIGSCGLCYFCFASQFHDRSPPDFPFVKLGKERPFPWKPVTYACRAPQNTVAQRTLFKSSDSPGAGSASSARPFSPDRGSGMYPLFLRQTPPRRSPSIQLLSKISALQKESFKNWTEATFRQQ